MEAGGCTLYASFADPLPYWTLSFYDASVKYIYAITHTCKKPVSSITFMSDPEAENGFRQEMEMKLANFTAAPEFRAPELCNLIYEETTTTLYGFNISRFNTTLSFLRLDDGDLRMYTYSPDIELNTWDITYQRFGCWRGVPQCGLPRKCGGFGVREKDQFVAYPQIDGLKGWSTSCSPPSLPNCKDASSNSSVDFYKRVGAEHFSSKYVNASRTGKTSLEECRRRCLNDCTCAAFFYWEESSACFHPQTVGTLNQLGNSTHLAFIKTVKKV